MSKPENIPSARSVSRHKASLQAAARDLVQLDAINSRSLAESEIAPVLKEVLIRHRHDIARLRRIVSRLLDDLDDVAEQPELFAMVHMVLDNPTEAGMQSLRDFAASVVNTPGRVRRA